MTGNAAAFTTPKQQLAAAALPSAPSASSLEDDFGDAAAAATVAEAWRRWRTRWQRIVGISAVSCKDL